MRGCDVIVPDDESHGAGDMDERIESVEEGQEVLVAVHEPLLDVEFSDEEQEAEDAEVFEGEEGDGVGLGCGPDSLAGEDFVGEDCGHAVEEVVEDPVEHFDEEGEFLEEAGVEMVLEAGGVGYGDLPEAAARARLWDLFLGAVEVL